MAVTDYIWDVENDSYLMETDENGETVAEYTNEPGQYGPLVSERRSEATSTYHFDAQHSTRQLTDEGETITDTATYTAFGQHVADMECTVDPFAYVGALGYYLDNRAANVYVRARTYDPKTSTWLAFDPVGFVDSVTRYTYARNNPLWLQDPSGLKCTAPTTVGANFVFGRGSFFGRIESGIPDTPRFEGYIDPMYLIAQWFPNPIAFHDAAGCCCCDKIGWVQIVRESAKYWGGGGIFVAEQRDNHDWIVDTDIPYPHGFLGPHGFQSVPTASNPCRRPSSSIGVSDQPGRPKHDYFGIPWLLESYLERWSFEAETCVVCLEGIEGLKQVTDVNEAAIVREKSVTVYGCVRWGFNLARRADGSLWVARSRVTTGRPDVAAWRTAMTSAQIYNMLP